jgi:hypothetical protein
MAEREGMEDTIVSLIMDSLHILEFETGWKKDASDLQLC